MAERTSGLLAWHMASEIELFFKSQPTSHCRKINSNSSQRKLSDVLVTGYVRTLEGHDMPLWAGFCIPSREEHPHGSRWTLRSLKVFCMLHLKSRVVEGFSQRNSNVHIKLARGWAPALPQFLPIPGKQRRHSCPSPIVLSCDPHSWLLKNLDLVFLFCCSFQSVK